MKHSIFKIKNYLVRPKALKAFDVAMYNQKMDEKQLQELQLKKLRKIFIHAKNTSSFYREKYKDISVGDIQTLQDWEKVPVLTKEEIRENGKDFFENEGVKRFGNKVTTGGSTGDPLEVYHDKRFPIDVLGWRVLSWWGLEISTDIAFIYRLVRTGWKAKINQLMWYPTRRLFLDASLMTLESMRNYANKVQALKPPLLQGYVGGVNEFAKFCHENNIKFNFLKAVWVTSAPVAEPQRLFLEEVFGAPVYDQYGCSEVFWLAAECKSKEGLHTIADSRYIETVDSDNHQVAAGVYGDVIVTDMENYLFPIIRYQNGDRGRYLEGDCECGVTFPRLDKIQGRISDVLRLPSGGAIMGEFLTTIFDDKPFAVKSFQLHQHNNYDVSIICVLGDGENAEQICQEKVTELTELTKAEIKVSLKLVDKIEHDRGKTRFIVSDLG